MANQTPQNQLNINFEKQHGEIKVLGQGENKPVGFKTT
jgi:hypothetical protein